MKLVPLFALTLTLLAAPALAQTPMPSDVDPLDARDARRLDRMEKVVRELRSIVFQGSDSGTPVVVQPAETNAQMSELTRRVEDLEHSLSRVNGQLEGLTHDLDQARRDSESMRAENKALTDRLAGLEQRGLAPDAAAPEALAPAPPGESDTEAFARSRQLMLDGDYDGAEAAFADFVSRYPDSKKTPEARYWWGKTLAVRGDHADAATAFIGAIRGWPQTSWAPDAVVELSRSLIALKKPADACKTLDELSRRYKPVAAVAGRAASTRAQAKCDA